MCLAAIYWARIDGLYYAANREDAAEAGFDDRFLYDEIARPPGARSLRTVQALRDEAIMALDAWRKKEDRIEY
jgi:tRNA(Arg) A34 adenosine deaminase TadA